MLSYAVQGTKNIYIRKKFSLILFNASSQRTKGASFLGKSLAVFFALCLQAFSSAWSHRDIKSSSNTTAMTTKTSAIFWKINHMFMLLISIQHWHRLIQKCFTLFWRRINKVFLVFSIFFKRKCLLYRHLMELLYWALTTLGSFTFHHTFSIFLVSFQNMSTITL